MAGGNEITPKVVSSDEICITAGGGYGASIENQYFYEDEIFRIDKNGRVKFGIVLENSEAFSSEDEDDFDDILFKGEIRAAWHPDGKEEILFEGGKTIGLADRTLMPGDVVRRLVPGKETQRGYCREINMKADVKVTGTNYVVKNVMAERLKPLLKMPRDNAVCMDSWVGSTKCCNEKIVLKTSCGALIEVSDHDIALFKDAKGHGMFAETFFYPGQTVTGHLEHLDNVKVLTPTNIPKTNKKGKPISRKFIVQSVQIEGVWVHWQCKALSEDGADLKSGVLQQPKSFVTGDDLLRLKRLNLFESCMLQINDKSCLKIENSDVILRKSQWEKEQAIKYKLILSQQQKEKNQLQQSTQSVRNVANSIEKIKIKLTNTSLDHEQQLPPSTNKRQTHKAHTNAKHNLETMNQVKEKFQTELMKAKSLVPPAKNSEQDTIVVTANQPVNPNLLNTNSAGGGNEQELNNANSDDWQTDEDDLADDDANSTTESTTTTISTCSSPTPKNSPKRRSPLIQKKHVKKLKKVASKAEKKPNVDDEVVTEAVVVYSTTTVVWQDGTIETDIPSTQLYPIHHLDDHEFFPGDFVLSGKDGENFTHRDYGAIQTVDHQGRTARVKWFTTYTSADDRKPTYTGESEVSVYDLKDHPDFQYRPGTIVIRVANFVGEDAICTAGQVIDNYAEGFVQVWWVDGHISMCWPQDLFEVGQYDSDNNFWGNAESDDSWETDESVSSEPIGEPKKDTEVSHLSANLERSRVAMARLEEMFIINPSLQTYEVMRQLLAVYKKCRYLDRLMNTSFFHEDHFMGLLERVRQVGSQSKGERAQDQKNRLFNQSPNSKNNGSTTLTSPTKNTCPLKESKIPLFVKSSTPYMSSTKRKQLSIELKNPGSSNKTQMQDESTVPNYLMNGKNNPTEQHSDFDANAGYESRLLSTVLSSIDRATQETEDLNKRSQNTLKIQPGNSQDDSGNFSRTEGGSSGGGSSSNGGIDGNGSSTSYASSTDLTNDVMNTSLLKAIDDQKSISSSSIELTEDCPEHVCARLCALLKCQLVKALAEIKEKYCKKQSNASLSEIESVEDAERTAPLEHGEDDLMENCNANDSTYSIEEVAEGMETVVITPILNIEAVPSECFQVLETAPTTHKFHLTFFDPTNPQPYFKAVRREHKLLKNSLPPGVWVRIFEDRMDLLSVMIEGPKNTPYEDGMFFFDIQLAREYPKVPPLCHYISFCSDRLNPNLYEDGKVCVSLLGTWSGRDSEIWGPNSTLLQVIVSIQGLILVAEPYFNEAGYEKQKGTQQGRENSRMYNEMVIIKMAQSITKILASPPEIFRDEILRHFKERGQCFYDRLKGWMEMSRNQHHQNQQQNSEGKSIQASFSASEQQSSTAIAPPEFSLVPASRGFCLTLADLLESFYRKFEAITTTDTTSTATPISSTNIE